MGQLGHLSPAASIAVGILVGLLSTSIQSIGLTLQRKSHLLEDSKQDDAHRRPPYRRRRWQLGMLMFVVSNLVGSTIQITTLPLPVLSTLQASGLVFNTICASVLLGEPFTRWSLGGTALVAGGAMLIALFGALPEPTHGLDQLLGLLRRPHFIAWMSCTFVAIAFILLTIFLLPRFTNTHRRPSSRSRSLSRSFTSQSMLTASPYHGLTPRMRLITGMSLGAVSAVLSAHCLLIAKSAVELLVQTATGANQFNRPESWLILVALVVFALSQLYFLHKGLRLCSTSVLYPFVFCIYNIIAILDGLIYFDQMDRLPPLHAGLIALGTCILLAGVLALSWRLGDDRSQEHLAQIHATAHSHSPTTAELGQQNLLTPGMGMLEDASTASPTPMSTPGFEADTYDWDDEEMAPDANEEGPLNGNSTERTALLAPKPGIGSRPRHYGTSSTPRRARFRDEPDEDTLDAWDALMDVGAKELAARDSPSRSRSRAKRARRSSTLGLLRTSHHTDEVGDDRAHGDGDAFLPLTPPPLRRARTVAGTPSSSRWTWLPRSPLTPRSWIPRGEDRTPAGETARRSEDGAQDEERDGGSTKRNAGQGARTWFAGLLGWEGQARGSGKTRVQQDQDNGRDEEGRE